MYSVSIFLLILAVLADGFSLEDVHCNVSYTTYLFILQVIRNTVKSLQFVYFLQVAIDKWFFDISKK